MRSNESSNSFPGSLEEALGWLEYCNSDSDSYYANLRRKNGREKPYGVSPLSPPRARPFYPV